MKKRSSVTRISRLILIIVSAVASGGGFAFLIFKTFSSDVSLTSDAWLGFWGSIIGSVVTMLGIILTLSYENKQNKTLRRLEAQPIITLSQSTLLAPHSENEYRCRIKVLGGKDDDRFCSLLPPIKVNNIGLNFATKIEFDFDFEGNSGCNHGFGGAVISILDTKESRQISLALDIPKDKIYNFFDNTYVVNKNELYHACCAKTIALLAQSNRKESIELIEKVSYNKGKIITAFEDIYGNQYIQERDATIYYVELKGEEPFAYIDFEEFAEAEF